MRIGWSGLTGNMILVRCLGFRRDCAEIRGLEPLIFLREK
jgi:hypothetical protein